MPIDAITVIGGGAKGAVWRQMMADIYDCRIEKLNFLEEATSMGAAVIGGVAAGVFASFDVIERFVRVDDVTAPNPANQAVYRSGSRRSSKAVTMPWWTCTRTWLELE